MITNLKIMLILLCLTLCFFISCNETSVSGKNVNEELQIEVHSAPEIHTSSDINSFFDYRQSQSSREQNYIFIPTNPLPNSNFMNIQTVNNVYIASCYVTESNISKLYVENSYENKMSSQSVYSRYYFNDHEQALKLNHIDAGDERIDFEGIEYYVYTEYALSDKEKSNSPVYYSIAYLMDGEYVYVLLPAIYDIKELLPYAAVERL